jgi:hypothetical protein
VAALGRTGSGTGVRSRISGQTRTDGPGPGSRAAPGGRPVAAGAGGGAEAARSAAESLAADCRGLRMRGRRHLRIIHAGRRHFGSGSARPGARLHRYGGHAGVGGAGASGSSARTLRRRLRGDRHRLRARAIPALASDQRRTGDAGAEPPARDEGDDACQVALVLPHAEKALAAARGCC